MEQLTKLMPVSVRSSDWMKGGMRYKRLRRLLRTRLEGEELQAFFIGTSAPLPRILKMTHFGNAVRALRADEYVVAVTDRAVHILEMGGMGLASARLDKPPLSIPLTDVNAEMETRKVTWRRASHVVTVEDRTFYVFPFHEADAAKFLRIVQADSTVHV